MKVVILDGATTVRDDLDWSGLTALPEVQLTVYDNTRPDELLSRCEDAEILITNKVLLKGDTLRSLPRLRYISTLSTGYNVIDLATAAELGISVSNIPAYSTDSVAQMVFALILEHAIGVGEHSRSVKSGDWARADAFCYTVQPLVELSAKTLGIVGYGSIGKRVAVIGRAFGMNVLATSPHYTTGDGIAQVATLDEIYRSSDYITYHCPLTDITRKMINADSIAMMKQGVVLVNTARGGLVDEQAVADALHGGKLGGFCADVAAVEPPRDHALFDAPHTVFTPHIAWATKEARSRLLATLVSNVRGYINGNIINKVN